MPSDGVIEVDKLDKNFKYEIAKEPGGESIMYCFQCGTCTAACPVSPKKESFNPRQLIHMAMLGMRDEVLSDEFVWYCSGCYACQERCPQGVTITYLMTALRNIAYRSGKGVQAHKEVVKKLAAKGWLNEIGEFDNEMRQKLGLPPITQKGEESDKVLKASGAKKLAGGE
jgi:heterodisulfide reductase subunit C2